MAEEQSENSVVAAETGKIPVLIRISPNIRPIHPHMRYLRGKVVEAHYRRKDEDGDMGLGFYDQRSERWAWVMDGHYTVIMGDPETLPLRQKGHP
jgi:hypothetical protein